MTDADGNILNDSMSALGRKWTRPERMFEPYQAKPPAIAVFSDH